MAMADPVSRVLNETIRQQRLASEPDASAWVSANAGSGKTHVLTQRVIRLLLNGGRPSAILCLTYTKAAASEMSTRIFERLSKWTSLDDQSLSAEISEMEGISPDSLRLQDARKLFARALETPGGLKIQTIHAFAESLLHQFPLEANVAGHFSVLDDTAARGLLTEARRSLLAATQGEGPLGVAFHHVLDIADESGLDRLLGNIIAQRGKLKAFFDATGSPDRSRDVLRKALGIEKDETRLSVAEQAWPLAGLGAERLNAYCMLAEDKGGDTVRKTASGLRQAFAEKDAGQRFFALRQLMLTKDETPYSERSFSSKEMRLANPALCEDMLKAAVAFSELWQRSKLIGMFEATCSALVLAERLISGYEQAKQARALLDFDDFITKTVALLKKEGIGPWVHFKLDQGIDHILVDEAQDTSPDQWEIIGALASEFFSGAGARPTNRTLFAVGDEKQSIYSFQGAKPERFAEERKATQRKAADASKRFHPVNLRISFRSTDDVLSAVDQMFSDPLRAKGLSADHDQVVHVTNRVGHAGSVEIWETIAEEPGSESDEDWLAPYDRTPETSSSVQLAKRMAAAMRQMVGRDTIVTRDGIRAIRPGDILVLVRKRDAFASALSRELKDDKKGTIPVAGTDRLVLSAHIAIQDLMALGRFLLVPADDLSLAELFKSPLFDLSEDDLFEVAADRGENIPLFDEIARLAANSRKWQQLHERLLGWMALANRLRPHDFYAAILAREGGRRNFLARFGGEVSDVLDEFLSFALNHESTGLPGLASFISVLENDPPTIKREQDKGRDEVRIMTVHASKGLEAPVVFLVDGHSKPFDKNLLSNLRMVPLGRDQPDIPLWIPGKDYQNAITRDDEMRLEEGALEEYRRLLYVGMTRASDRLILCSFAKKRDVDGTWSKMAEAALIADGEICRPMEFKAGDLAWTGRIWQRKHDGTQLAQAGNNPPVPAPDKDVPAILFHPLPPSPHLPRPLAPSGVNAMIDDEDGDQIVTSTLFRDRPSGSFAQDRGKAVHRLLQTLPDMECSERRAAALRYLSRAMGALPEMTRQAIADQVLAILDNPDHQPLFAAGSTSEVSIMGTVRLADKDFAVSGRIDRMGVSANGVFILDYKTNRAPPKTRDAIPFAHRAQLALYREVLSPIFPGKAVSCLLAYTEGPHLYSLNDDELGKALLEIRVK
jgi:ATP-dependent helicase/nuclease subunit A